MRAPTEPANPSRVRDDPLALMEYASRFLELCSRGCDPLFFRKWFIIAGNYCGSTMRLHFHAIRWLKKYDWDRGREKDREKFRWQLGNLLRTLYLVVKFRIISSSSWKYGDYGRTRNLLANLPLIYARSMLLSRDSSFPSTYSYTYGSETITVPKCNSETRRLTKRKNSLRSSVYPGKQLIRVSASRVSRKAAPEVALILRTLPHLISRIFLVNSCPSHLADS